MNNEDNVIREHSISVKFERFFIRDLSNRQHLERVVYYYGDRKYATCQVLDLSKEDGGYQDPHNPSSWDADNDAVPEKAALLYTIVYSM